MSTNTLDLTRTAKAVADFDAHNTSGPPMNDSAKDAWWAKWDRLSVLVADAFALDTADRNKAATARLVHPKDSWLRRLLEKYGPDALPTPEEPAQ